MASAAEMRCTIVRALTLVFARPLANRFVSISCSFVQPRQDQITLGSANPSVHVQARRWPSFFALSLPPASSTNGHRGSQVFANRVRLDDRHRDSHRDRSKTTGLPSQLHGVSVLRLRARPS